MASERQALMVVPMRDLKSLFKCDGELKPQNVARLLTGIVVLRNSDFAFSSLTSCIASRIVVPVTALKFR